jgi:hypothetical protein
MKTKTKLLGVTINEKDLKRLEVEAVKNKFRTSSYAKHLIFKALQQHKSTSRVKKIKGGSN